VVFLRAIFQLFLKQLIFLFLLASSIVREVGFKEFGSSGRFVVRVSVRGVQCF
jgi:hypothetical protein